MLIIWSVSLYAPDFDAECTQQADRFGKLDFIQILLDPLHDLVSQPKPWP